MGQRKGNKEYGSPTSANGSDDEYEEENRKYFRDKKADSRCQVFKFIKLTSILDSYLYF